MRVAGAEFAAELCRDVVAGPEGRGGGLLGAERGGDEHAEPVGGVLRKAVQRCRPRSAVEKSVGREMGNQVDVHTRNTKL